MVSAKMISSLILDVPPPTINWLDWIPITLTLIEIVRLLWHMMSVEKKLTEEKSMVRKRKELYTTAQKEGPARKGEFGSIESKRFG
jgi:hypothetical protein